MKFISTQRERERIVDGEERVIVCTELWNLKRDEDRRDMKKVVMRGCKPDEHET